MVRGSHSQSANKLLCTFTIQIAVENPTQISVLLSAIIDFSLSASKKVKDLSYISRMVELPLVTGDIKYPCMHVSGIDCCTSLVS